MNNKLVPTHILPREKLKRFGAAQLKDYELIALLLRTGISKKNVLDLSREILDGKQIEGLTSMTLSELGRINGLGQSKAASLIAAFEIGKRLYSAVSHEEVTINSPSDVSDQLREIRSKAKEHFVAFLLNARNQLMRKEIISIGTLSASLVHPREVFEPAISYKSAAIIVAHNHPSGDPTPSDADIKITAQLAEAGNILGIEILDHVIVTGEKYLSMKAEGYIK
ncbi:DNA repair protein RadC [Candidatus Roizmanbacteria bacterium]|nr:MAG: DNA repair protein RadC [Candidatus Roizmanbacteria bacterium]